MVRRGIVAGLKGNGIIRSGRVHDRLPRMPLCALCDQEGSPGVSAGECTMCHYLLDVPGGPTSRTDMLPRRPNFSLSVPANLGLPSCLRGNLTQGRSSAHLDRLPPCAALPPLRTPLTRSSHALHVLGLW